MKSLVFLALFALAANASFNMTAYHLGLDNKLGFNSTEIQADMTCLNAITGDIGQIAALIQTHNIDNIITELGDLVEQTRTDIYTTCKPYWSAFGTYVLENVDYENLGELIKQNFEKYYPQIFQILVQWVDMIEDENYYAAGQTQGTLLQILWGVVQPKVEPVPVANTTVPFNSSKFYNEYFGLIFKALGINAQVNASALIECSYEFQNSTAIYLYLKSKFSTMDFDQRLDGVQYLLSHGFETIRNCQGATSQVSLIYGPIFKAFSEDPVKFTLTVGERIAAVLPQYIESIEQETVDIQEGEYDLAAELKAQRLEYDNQGLVNFTSSDN